MSIKSSLIAWFIRQFKTARDVVRFALRFYGGRIALVDRRGVWTYAELRERSLRLSAALEAAGIGKGDLVFTWLPETGEQVELRLATFENGAILAAFHQHLPPEATLQFMRTVRPKMFVHDPLLSATMLAQVRQEFPGTQLLALGDDFEKFLHAQAPRRSRAALGPQDVASLHLTSGTTGQPKAIGVTGGKYLRQLRMVGADVGNTKPESGARGPDVLMLGLPLTGPGGGMVLPVLLSGATLVVPTHYDTPHLAQLIQRWRVTLAFLSPSTIIDLLDDPNLGQYDLSSLQRILYGSEMMAAAKMAEAIRVFGPIFQQGYGSFEAMPPLAWLRPDDHIEADGSPASLDVLGSAGYTAAGVDIKIVGEDFEALPDGAIGRVLVNTPLAFSGYWGRPELDDAILREGWVLTGDMGYFDTLRRLHVLGRQADTVRRGSQQIYPRQVEEVVHMHAAVKEACLVEIEDQAHLVVTLRHAWTQNPDRESVVADLQAHLDEHLAAERHPDLIHIVDKIPRSFLNKMLRREVRDQLLRKQRAPMGLQAPRSNPYIPQVESGHFV